MGNKVSKRVAKILEDKDQMNSLLNLIFNDPKIPRTNNVHVVVFEEELNDEDDICLEAKLELKQFIQDVKDSYVVSEEVNDLKINEVEELQVHVAARQTEILKQTAEMQAHEAKIHDTSRDLVDKKWKMEEERQQFAKTCAAAAKLL